MAAFNPYETLNINKAADEKMIRAAAKRHAKKHHPDGGGDPDTFVDGRRALAILLNPTAREKFDRTGEVAPDAVDITVNKAIEIIETELTKLIDGFLRNEMKPDTDPCRLNVASVIAGEIKIKIAIHKKSRTDGDRYIAFLRKFAKRFSKKKDVIPFDFIQRRLDDRIKEAGRQFEEIERTVEIHELALKIINSYEFKAEGFTATSMLTIFT